MTPQEMVAFIGAILGIVGWIEVRCKNLVTAATAVQDAKHEAAEKTAASLGDVVRELSTHVMRLAEAIGKLEGRLESR